MIVTTTDLQNSFGKYLQLCQNEEVIITKNGKKVAKLLP
ncbi:MAG TPA: prevent-host-death protein, partial [Firmicutes bacterium]|nr:prevent-host-death protein [Bacillota bacterium]